ncbi:MAG: hypothetical protein JNK47_02885 [Mesorhizobium sp.]|nr:hypothetical protein [Mesorhizobium sp.]MBL8576146.1 hypothetical protein [Mesorhizobium sp.]
MVALAYTPTAEQVDAVHEWRERRKHSKARAIVPVLREAFGISAGQAVAVIRAANADVLIYQDAGGADAAS